MADRDNFDGDMAFAGNGVLRGEALACRRGGRVIFENLSFSLPPGHALRLAGANGSGKSSLLRQLAGLLPLAGGTLMHGFTPSRHMHYLGHDDGLKAAFSVAETLALEAALAGRNASNAVLADLGLADCAWQFVGDLSAGQKRRLTLARLCLDRRPLWLLDEPMTALDAHGRELVEDLAAAHLARGGMVVAASHEALSFANDELRLGAGA
jgi:heme exporter protein A